MTRRMTASDPWDVAAVMSGRAGTSRQVETADATVLWMRRWGTVAVTSWAAASM